MHSSVLRGSDFQLSWHGRPVAHEDFFAPHERSTRLGLLAPSGTEGIGAATFALACVTAFYDRYRAAGGHFFAYPDFYSFQCRGGPLANYGAFDFWPDKDVLLPGDADAAAAAIVDRAVDVLLVPDPDLPEHEHPSLPVDRLRPSVRCFAYHADGAVANANLTIACSTEPFRAYARDVLASADRLHAAPEWVANAAVATLEQSFRELDLARLRLRPPRRAMRQPNLTHL